MAYDLAGCMKKGDGDKWQPVWIDPCDGVTEMPGCMIKSAEKWAPKLEGGFGICTDDKTGCMRLAGGAHRPILIYDEYDSEDELVADCCPWSNCFCWLNFGTPRFIEVTFTGIQRCPVPSYPDPNGTYILEFRNTPPISEPLDACDWFYTDEGTPLRTVRVRLYTDGFATEVVRVEMGGHGGATKIFLNTPEAFDCETIEDGEYDNINKEGNCVPPSPGGYGGTATIVWEDVDGE